MTSITSDQYAFLTRGIDGDRVQNLRGQSHLEAWDVRRTLIRAFGFDGFDIETKGLTLVREIEHAPGTLKIAKWNNGNKTEVPNAETRWTVIYRAEIRLIIKVDGQPIAVFEDAASGDSCNQPSLGDAHDMAMKTALSQGLKRCAVNLGDQFGMSLYDGGSKVAVVKGSLVRPEAPAVPPELGTNDEPVRPEPQAVAPVSAPPAQEARPVSAPPAPRPPAVAPAAELAQEPDDGGAEIDQRPAAVPGGMMPDNRKRRMFALFGELGQTDKEVQLRFMNWACKPDEPIVSRSELTAAECETVIKALETRKRELAAGTVKPGAVA